MKNYLKFNLKLQKEIISKLIDSYDYEAANVIAKMNEHRLNPKLKDLLSFAVDRYHLKYKDNLTLSSKLNMKELMPYRQDEKVELFEYALWLKIKCDKGDCLDVCRGINPFMYKACELYLKQKLKIDLKKYYDGKCLKINLLQSDEIGREVLTILDYYYNGYDEKALTEAQMLCIIKDKNLDSEVIKSFNELDHLRTEIRNTVSHQISALDEQIIVRKTGYDLDYYITQIKTILKKLDYDVSKYWDSYNQMNGLIKEIL